MESLSRVDAAQPPQALFPVCSDMDLFPSVLLVLLLN